MIPQVNAKATDRNRAQTRRICELKGWGYNPNYSPRPHAFELQGWNKTVPPKEIDLPNGSFTLCQVVGMLEKEGVEWDCGDCAFEQGEFVSKDDKWRFNPHGLTAALDALIKVLEEKK